MSEMPAVYDHTCHKVGISEQFPHLFNVSGFQFFPDIGAADITSFSVITSAVFFSPNVKWWMLVFSYISILAYALIFAFVDIAPTKNKNEQIEKAEREQYGELFDIIQEVNAGNIIAAEVDSISMEQSVPTLELCLECKDGYFGRKLLFFKPVLTMARDKKYAGALSVDLQSEQAICYFKDAVTTAEALELPEKVLRKGR